MFYKFKSLTILLVIVFISSLACNLTPTRRPTPTKTPIIPTSPVTVSTMAVGELEKKVESAYKDLQAGKAATITVTEAELTSMVAFAIKNISSSEVAISSPEIRLRPDQIVLRGQMKQGNFNTDAEIIFTPFITPNGDLQLKIVSGKIGPLPIPQPLLSTISQLANEALIDAITINNKPLKLQSITVTQGKLTVTGVLK